MVFEVLNRSQSARKSKRIMLTGFDDIPALDVLVSVAMEHAMAVYSLAREVRKRCPGLTIEAHDPV